MSNPPTDPDSNFLAINDHEMGAAKTLILMEFADIGSLDQYAVRTSFKRNLVGDRAELCAPCMRWTPLVLCPSHTSSRGAQVLFVGSQKP